MSVSPSGLGDPEKTQLSPRPNPNFTRRTVKELTPRIRCRGFDSRSCGFVRKGLQCSLDFAAFVCGVWIVSVASLRQC